MTYVYPGFNRMYKVLGGIVGVSSGLLTLAWYKSNVRDVYAEDKKKTDTDDNIDFSYVNFVNDHSKDTERNHIKRNSKVCGLSSHNVIFNKKYKKIVPKIFKILHQAKEEFGTPGISFSISYNGDLVLKGGIGLADVENHVPCTSETVLRIASISKSLTTLAIGKLMEEGKLDLNKPVQEYVPNFPLKTFEGSNVAITTYDLLSHTSGIRGYFDDKGIELTDDKSQRKRNIRKSKFGDNFFDSDEMYNKNYYEKVADGLTLFENDPLIFKPGTDYEYSSIAYTLVSCIVEKASKVDYVKYMKSICDELGMDNTMVDLNDPLIYHRARNYIRKNGRLQNVPYVDNSYKWCGGGFLSNVEDLQKFGNAMLISAATDKGFLKPSTVSTLWTPCGVTTGKESEKYPESSYALGWAILPNRENQRRAVLHTGGAIGCSSVFMLRKGEQLQQNQDQKLVEPNGSVIAIIVNMESVGLTETALKIEKCLQEAI